MRNCKYIEEKRGDNNTRKKHGSVLLKDEGFLCLLYSSRYREEALNFCRTSQVPSFNTQFKTLQNIIRKLAYSSYLAKEVRRSAGI